MSVIRLSTLTALALFLSGQARAETAVGWRKDGTGRFTDARPPLHWSPTRNVRWKTPMPAWGNASPIVVGDRVYVGAEPATLLCLDANTGRILWQKATEVIDALTPEEAAQARPLIEEATKADAQLTEQLQEVSRLSRELRKRAAGPADKEKLDSAIARANALKLALEKAARYRTTLTNDTIGSASATPVSDGHNVYVAYGNGVVTSFDANGGRRWARWLGEPRREGMNGYAGGHAASPLLVGGKLIVPFEQLTALDPTDGKILWRSVPYRDAGTPAVATLTGGAALVTPDGHLISVVDGTVLAEQLTQIFYSGPVVEGRTAFFSGSAEVAELLQHGHAIVRAVPLEGTRHPLWETNLSKDYYISSPVVLQGLLYTLSESGSLTAVDAKTGAVVYEQKLGAAHGVVAYPSLTIAGRLLFASTDDGTTRVIRPGRKFEQIAENVLEPLRASPFFAGRRLYVRSLDNLFCIEEK